MAFDRPSYSYVVLNKIYVPLVIKSAVFLTSPIQLNNLFDLTLDYLCTRAWALYTLLLYGLTFSKVKPYSSNRIANILYMKYTSFSLLV